jgi:hypothetical protein
MHADEQVALDEGALHAGVGAAVGAVLRNGVSGAPAVIKQADSSRGWIQPV